MTITMKTIFLGTLLLAVVLVPAAAFAQCGAGSFGGWMSGPATIGSSPFGFEYQGLGGGSWDQLPHGNDVDFLPGNLFSWIGSFFGSVANAQCGGQPSSTPRVTLTATPGTINAGNSSTLTWGSANVASCTGVGFETGGATHGSVPVSPTSTTDYEVVCSVDTSGYTWQEGETQISDLSCSDATSRGNASDYGAYQNQNNCSDANPVGKSCTPGSRCKISNWGAAEPTNCMHTSTIFVCAAGETVSDDVTVVVNSGGPLAVSCSANPNPQSIDDSVTWSASASGGSGGYSYSWSGSDGLTGSGSSVQKSYSTTGMKSASVMVTSGAQATSVACEALEVENPVAPECSDGIDNNGMGGTDTDDTEACDGPDDDDERNPNGNLSCTVDSNLIDVGANTTYHAFGVAGPYTWQLSGQTDCTDGANNNCNFPNPGDYSMRVSAPGVGTPKLCPFVKAGCEGSPTVDIKADKIRVNVKDTVRLTWTASGVMQATCVIQGPGVNEIVTPSACMLSDGMQSPPILTQSIYSIDCGEDAKDTIIINVTSDQIEF